LNKTQIIIVAFLCLLSFMEWMRTAFTLDDEYGNRHYYTVEFWCDRYEWAEMLYNEDWSMSDTCYKDGAFYNLNVENHEK
jgi:hypothetical protein